MNQRHREGTCEKRINYGKDKKQDEIDIRGKGVRELG